MYAGVSERIRCDTCGTTFEGAPGVALEDGWSRTRAINKDGVFGDVMDFCPKCVVSFNAIMAVNNKWADDRKRKRKLAR